MSQERYPIDVVIYGTAYVNAASEEEARQKVAEAFNDTEIYLDETQDDVDGGEFDTNPERFDTPRLSPVATISKPVENPDRN